MDLRKKLEKKEDSANLLLMGMNNNSTTKIELDELRMGGRQVGSGGFGVVFEATYKGERVACKIIDCTPQYLKSGINKKSLFRSYMNEVRAYNEIKGKHILRFLGHYEEKTSSQEPLRLFILTEYMEKVLS